MCVWVGTYLQGAKKSTRKETVTAVTGDILEHLRNDGQGNIFRGVTAVTFAKRNNFHDQKRSQTKIRHAFTHEITF